MGKLNGHTPSTSHFTGKKGFHQKSHKKKVKVQHVHKNKYENVKGR